MKEPMPRENLRRLIIETVQRNYDAGAVGDLLVDIIFSGGLEGATMKQSGRPAHCYIAVQYMIPPPPEAYSQGVTLATCIHQRMCADVKLLNYVAAILAHQTIVPNYNAFDVLFVTPPNGELVLEGSTFTVFFINRNGEVCTPPLDGKVLDSVTRRVILELLKPSTWIRVIERDIETSELNTFTECFLASTTRNVLPVVRINDSVIGNGKPGPVTNKISHVLDAYIRSA